ncbi:MAG TPA: recombinase family protein [Methylomirabilota bacterium]|nr:recombinase family protein [Methylomirabilota bacterium]
MAAFYQPLDPFAHLGRPRTQDWLEEHDVVWDRTTGVLPTIVLGVYRRMSTLGQATGYRQQSMIEDMTGVVLAKGPAFGVIVFDEGNRSGTVLANRKVALAMIRALDQGVIDGIATPDAKRLSRDQYLGGGREIVLAVRQRKAMLMLGRGDVVNLRNYRERKLFERELRDASDEVGEIRQTMYSGWAARARKVVEGKVEPMFRGPAPFGYCLVECRDEYGDVVRNRGVPRRTLAKLDEDAPGIARMIELFNDEQRSINMVARRLNREGIGRRIHKSAYSHGFTGDRLRGILENPTYYGVWKAIREKSSDLWDDFDEADLTTAVPHLAYWTERQARDWLDKFTPVVGKRARIYDRPFLGLLLCATCGGLLVGAGAHGYRCRYENQQKQGIVKGMCAEPQNLSAPRAAEALRELFGRNIAIAAKLIVDEHERQKAEAKVDPIADELALLARQEKDLIALVMGRGLEGEAKRSYDWIVERRQQLLERQARQQVVVRLSDEQVAFVADLSQSPLEIYDGLTPNEQAELWRLLKVQVKIWRTSGRGVAAKYAAAIVGGAESLTETGVWLVQSYVTGEGEVA